MTDRPDDNLLALVVDDQPICRALMRARLEALGHRVVEAADGAEAVEQHGSASPDIVFLDFDMPVMDGRTASVTLRGLGTRAVIVGFSANLSGGRRTSGLRAGMDFVFAKHLSREELSTALALASAGA